MIEGDSTEYEILKEACQTLEGDDLFTAEIGVRQGQGSKIILDELISKKHWHIGIDPYGNLDYQHYDKSESYVCDYTNEMKIIVNEYGFMLLKQGKNKISLKRN